MKVKQIYLDWLGRRIYKFLYYLIYFFINSWFIFGRYLSNKYDLKCNIYFPTFFFLNGFFDFSDHNKKKIIKIKKNNINIILVGDTHSNYEKIILKELKKYDLMIHLGDLKYNNDSKISYLNNKKILMTLGDKELISNKFNQKWNFEECVRYFPYVNKEFYNINLQMKNYDIDIYFIHNFFIPGTFKYFKLINWLNKNIKKSSAKYKIISCHAPPYSISRHGNDYLTRLILETANILDKIDLIMSGHDHTYINILNLIILKL